MQINIARDLRLVPLDTLLPYAKNARTHSDSQIDQIADSIKEFGFTNPILVDGTNGIIAGHGRFAAAKKIGLVEVPVIDLAHLTPQQKRAYIIADNQIALNAGWDESILHEELKLLELEQFDLDILGFSERELENLLEDDGLVPNASTQQLYTKKIKAPIYEPKGEMPDLGELIDPIKTNQIKDQIFKSDVPQDVKDFLYEAARRHTVFHYEKIAEYYAHAPKEVQDLMEKSALVIIDFNKAIENGFVVMTKAIAEAYTDDV